MSDTSRSNGPEQQQLHILVTADQPWCAIGAQSFLDSCAVGSDVRPASSDSELTRQLSESWPDILVYAAPTSAEHHMESLGRLRRRWPAPPMMLWSVECHPELAARAQDLGVQGYIYSEMPAAEVDAALRRVAGGSTHFAVVEEAGAQAARSSRAEPADLPARLKKLTRREQQVMDLLGQGYSNREIAETLGLREGTIRIYVHRVIRQLGLRNRVDVALVASRMQPAA